MDYIVVLLFVLLLSINKCYGAVAKKWTFQQTLFESVNVYARSPFVQYGRGMKHVLSGLNRDISEMYVSVQSAPIINPIVFPIYSLQAVMAPKDSIPAIFGDDDNSYGVPIDDGDNYASWLAMGGNRKTGLHFAVTAPHKGEMGNQNKFDDLGGAVYIYRGSYTAWSNTQLLYPNERRENFIFGQNVAIDQINPTQMIITSYYSACFYKSRPDGSEWSLQQVMYAPEYDGPMDDNYYQPLINKFGYRISLFDNLFAITCLYGDWFAIGALYIYSSDKNSQQGNRWSFQQKLSEDGMARFGEFTALYNTSIVVGLPLIIYKNSVDGVEGGAAYSYECFDNSLLSCWSLSQKLYPNDLHSYMYFGSSVSSYENILAVGAFGEGTETMEYAGAAYIFERKDAKLNTMWSQQKKLISPTRQTRQYFGDPFLFGTNVVIRADNRGYLYTNDLYWNCLIVTMYDSYGDGWDTGQLFADSIGDSIYDNDKYAPYCRSSNTFIFRYCPICEDNSSEVTLSVYYPKKHKYWAGIQWSVCLETERKSENKILFGDVNTTVTYAWNTDQLTYTLTHVSNNKENGILCPCNDCTDDSVTPSEQYCSMSIPFAIYDSSGIELIGSGFACSEYSNLDCHIPSDDGNYIVRVGGATTDDETVANFNWEMCNSVGNAKEQMQFSVTDGVCQVTSSYVIDSCSEDLGPYLYCTAYFVLSFGNDTSMSTLHQYDYVAISEALNDFISSNFSIVRIVSYEAGDKNILSDKLNVVAVDIYLNTSRDYSIKDKESLVLYYGLLACNNIDDCYVNKFMTSIENAGRRTSNSVLYSLSNAYFAAFVYAGTVSFTMYNQTSDDHVLKTDGVFNPVSNSLVFILVILFSSLCCCIVIICGGYMLKRSKVVTLPISSHYRENELRNLTDVFKRPLSASLALRSLRQVSPRLDEAESRSNIFSQRRDDGDIQNSLRNLTNENNSNLLGAINHYFRNSDSSSSSVGREDDVDGDLLTDANNVLCLNDVHIHTENKRNTNSIMSVEFDAFR